MILTGDGPKAFCAGADIAEWGASAPLEFGRRWVRRGAPRVRPLGPPAPAGDRRRSTASPSAAGWSSPPRADLRVAEAHARVGLPESQVGIVPGWSGTQRLVRRAGSPAVKRLVLTGEPVDAAEALRLGLVDEVCASGEGMARARELAATIARRAPVAVQIAKLLVNAAEGEESLGRDRGAGRRPGRDHGGRARGRPAFREKRPPQFEGR